MSVNKMAMQRSGKTIFQSLVGGGGCCGIIWPTEKVEIATFCEFDENDRFSTTLCDPYISHTFRLFLTHITIKRT